VITVELFQFWVPGVPIPQGSKIAGVTKDKRPYLRDSNGDALKPWRRLVAASAAEAYTGPQIDGAVSVVIEFLFVRGKTVTREFPSVKPDLDKLERAILDGLTDSKVWGDDSQVVDLSSRKRYGVSAGACVRVGRVEEERA
jgi:Holliday junction resolvase RusA-like endonuclease